MEDKILERAYFHISNGGFTFEVIEKTTFRESVVLPKDWGKSDKYITGNTKEILESFPTETKTNRYYKLRVKLNTFGSGVSFDFPLVPVILHWFILISENVLNRIEETQNEPTDGSEHALRNSYGLKITNSLGVKLENELFLDNGNWKPVPKLEKCDYECECDSGSDDECMVKADV